MLTALPAFADQGIRQYNTPVGNQNATFWTPPGGTAGTIKLLTSDPTNKYWISENATTILTSTLDADLQAFAALDATAGYIVKTAANTYARRTFTSTGSTVTITNPAGTAGNTNLEVGDHSAALLTTGTVDNARLDTTLQAFAALDGTAGFVVVTGADTLTRRSFAVGSAKLTVANPAGTAGNVTYDLGTVAESDITNLTTDLANKQPLDSDLTTLAGLSGASKVVARKADDSDYELISGGTGTVTNFSAAPTGIFDVATSTTTPALSLDNQNANVFLAGPSSGSAATPAFRAVVPADIAFTPIPTTTVVRSLVLAGPAFTTHTWVGFATAMTLIYPGSETALLDSDGQFISCAAAASTNSDAGVRTSTINAVSTSMIGLKVYFHIKTGSSLATCRIQVGVGEAVATVVAADDPADDLALFRYAPATDGTAFWRTGTNDDSGTGTYTTTSSAIATDTDYWMCIDFSESGHVKFFIDDMNTAVADHTTNLPSSNTLQLLANIRTLENVAKTIRTGAIHCLNTQ